MVLGATRLPARNAASGRILRHEKRVRLVGTAHRTRCVIYETAGNAVDPKITWFDHVGVGGNNSPGGGPTAVLSRRTCRYRSRRRGIRQAYDDRLQSGASQRLGPGERIKDQEIQRSRLRCCTRFGMPLLDLKIATFSGRVFASTTTGARRAVEFCSHNPSACSAFR